MQEVWITERAEPRVILFALGWAGSEELISHLDPINADMVCVYDYRTVERSPELTAKLLSYKERHLIGWSFGVWAASQLFGDIQWDSATAIGGTPHPVDSEYGIPPRAFEITLKSIEGAGTAKFLQRMCGAELRHYLAHRSTRPIDQICRELQLLGEMSTQKVVATTPALEWSHAIVGGADQIFPPTAMRAYWQTSNAATTTIDQLPHYPIHDLPQIMASVHQSPFFRE